MPAVKELKRIVEKLTGIGRPAPRELGRLARPPAPQLFRRRPANGARRAKVRAARRKRAKRA